MCYDAPVPTVLRFENLRIVTYPNDHRPAHVHVFGPEHEAVFNLRCPTGPTQLRENYGFPMRRLRHIELFLNGHVAELCDIWKEIHGLA